MSRPIRARRRRRAALAAAWQLGDIRRDPPRLGRMYAGRGFNLHQLSISLIKIKNGTNRRQFRQFGAIRTELGNLCTKNREISV
jgi:hypothetical protein